MKFIRIYLSILIPLIVLDMTWILFIAKDFYAMHLGYLFGAAPELVPGVLFYVIYTFAIAVLVVMPALRSNSWRVALGHAALFGIAAYGAYDLTNQATIAHWPTAITLVDMTWGVCVTSAASLVGFFLLRNK